MIITYGKEIVQLKPMFSTFSKLSIIHCFTMQYLVENTLDHISPNQIMYAWAESIVIDNR